MQNGLLTKEANNLNYFKNILKIGLSRLLIYQPICYHCYRTYSWSIKG
jgi:hypothetical protein